MWQGRVAVCLTTVAAAATAIVAMRWRRRRVQEAMLEAWNRDGYIIVRGLLSPAECARLEEAVSCDGGIEAHAYGRDDGMGRRTRMALWNHPGNDVTGMIARVPRVRATMEMLLGGPVYHYHTKLMMKDARTGGAHLWHQDFGYWSNNGCAFPHMGTAFIPIDKMDAENAGLRVIRGSHEMGLIQHKTTASQAEVDATRLGYANKLLETVQLELEPGDCCFFHCLTLHSSGQNHSDRRRWCFLVAYNRMSNDPLIEHHHPRATPLAPARDDGILNPATPLVDTDGKDFMDPSDVSHKRPGRRSNDMREHLDCLASAPTGLSSEGPSAVPCSQDKSVKKYAEHGFH